MFDGKYLDWNQKRVKGIIDHYGYQFMQGKKILDLGCGHADVGGALYRLGGEVTALDARQEHLKIVAKKFPGIKTVKADLDGKWPFATAKFDMILDLDLLCHLTDFEAHLRSVCNSTTHLILETTVCDSTDPHKVYHVQEGKHQYDMSANGQGCRPSAAAIERVLNECGFSFKRHDNPKFNSGAMTYDWRTSNDNSCDTNKRRLWFAVRASHPQVSATTQSTTTHTVQPHQIVLNSGVKPGHNPKLANQYIVSKPRATSENVRAALCISGHLRTFLDNYKTVKDNILDKMKCDVFIHTWDTLGLSYRHTDGSLHITETQKLVDTITQLYNPKKIVIEKSRHFLVSPVMQQRLLDHRDVSGILSMFYKIEACNALKAQYELENEFKYDCVIRFRGDLWVEQPIPIDNHTNLEHIFLPIYGNFGGACDQFAFGNSELMDKYSCLYSNMDKYMQAGAPLHPERLLMYHLDYQKLPIAKVNFKYVIKRANGLIQDNMLLERALGIRK